MRSALALACATLCFSAASALAQEAPAAAPAWLNGRHELSIALPFSLSGDIGGHEGLSLDYAFHLRDRVALTAGGTWFFRTVRPNEGADELIDKGAKTNLVPPFPSDPLLHEEAHVGLTILPIDGTLHVLHDTPFRLEITVGAGVADTRVELKDERWLNDQKVSERTFGSTGLHPLGLIRVGALLTLAPHVALHLDLREQLAPVPMDRIDGCSFNQLKGEEPARNGCTLPPTDADKSIAADILKDGRPQLLHLLTASVGLSLLF